VGLTYIDTCIWIYLNENQGRVGDEARVKLAALDDPIAWSHLVRMECVVKHYRNDDFRAIDAYDRGFRMHRQLPIGEAQFERATVLRAKYGIATPDALHLATAQTHGCTSFWTNDDSLAAAAGGLDIEVLR
jgi:predicted nucleic acid-binding protein